VNICNQQCTKDVRSRLRVPISTTHVRQSCFDHMYGSQLNISLPAIFTGNQREAFEEHNNYRCIVHVNICFQHVISDVRFTTCIPISSTHVWHTQFDTNVITQLVQVLPVILCTIHNTIWNCSKITHKYRVLVWIFAISMVQKMCVQDYGSHSVAHMFGNHVLTRCMVHNWTYHYLPFSLAINESRLINTTITDALFMWIFAFNMWYPMCVLQYASRSVAHMFGKLCLTHMLSPNWPNYYLWFYVQFTTQFEIIKKYS
jgi:hypothetical protein